MKTNKAFSAMDIVKKFKLSYQTVNYYTNLGLLKVTKGKGNKRYYHKQDVERRLEEINSLKRRGYPLRLICELLSRN